MVRMPLVLARWCTAWPAVILIDLVTLFPAECAAWCRGSIVGRAWRRGLVRVECTDPRAWAGGRHRVVDDRPCGGGPGMVLAAPPLAGCIDALRDRAGGRGRLLLPTPQGPPLRQERLAGWSREPHLVIVCGHYEGIDERIVELYQPEEFSLGDYVLSGGELAALVVVEALVRLLPGALGDEESAVGDSFTGDGLLDHPCYTRPREFRGRSVPEVLLGGDHVAIAAWREARRVERTRARRPDLLAGPGPGTPSPGGKDSGSEGHKPR
jgi:tRNA (guanine37-N1)-methyltransferase